MTVKMDRMAGHAEIADADAHPVVLPHVQESMPGKTRLLKVNRLKSSMVLTRGV